VTQGHPAAGGTVLGDRPRREVDVNILTLHDNRDPASSSNLSFLPLQPLHSPPQRQLRPSSLPCPLPLGQGGGKGCGEFRRLWAPGPQS